MEHLTPEQRAIAEAFLVRAGWAHEQPIDDMDYWVKGDKRTYDPCGNSLDWLLS